VFRELLLRRVSAFCSLSTAQVDQLQQHYELMMRWNKVINLTRIERMEEVLDRHYAESLFLGSNLPAGPITIGDVGSGAGFPGLPIAVLRPESRITLIESHQRKAVFLKEAGRVLPNVAVISKRAEDATERFDWIVSRAVSWVDLERVALRLAPNLALLVTDAPPSPGSGLSIRSLPLPWDEHRAVVMITQT
jgi:16S rRNA (guanine527-N7)-methyltransferase